MNPTTARLFRRFERLPASKKKKILELLGDEPTSGRRLSGKDLDAWKTSLLQTSVWSEEDVQRIYEVRAWMSRWNPASS